MSWKDRDILYSDSLLVQYGIRSLIHLNPEWDVQIYIDEEIDEYLYKNIDTKDYNIIRECHIVEKTDLWRLVKLYNEGGMYIDIDRYCNVKLDDVIDPKAKCVLPICNNNDFSHDIMISSSNNPIYDLAFQLNIERRREGHTSTYFLGPQTYMHAITQLLVNQQIDTNPGEETFDSIRKKINEIEFIQTYCEKPPLDTFVYRHNKLENWEYLKRELYNKNNMKHWTGEW